LMKYYFEDKREELAIYFTPNAPQKGEEVGHTTYGPRKKLGRNFRRSRIQVILFNINILVHFNVVPEREKDC
jgi:hypothetical protein